MQFFLEISSSEPSSSNFMLLGIVGIVGLIAALFLGSFAVYSYNSERPLGKKTEDQPDFLPKKGL